MERALQSCRLEWQDAVIRAAITLKLCWYEETGGILAAMTTLNPRSPEHAAQLGLPLLLGASGCTLHDPRR